MSEPVDLHAAVERIRLYVELMPHPSLGAEMAFDKRFITPGWPRGMYALARDDLMVVMAALEQALERADPNRGMIYKLEPDQDLYLLWSTMADGPKQLMTRAEALERKVAPSRLKRADETGTSDVSRADGGWDDDFYMVDQLGWLHRKDLHAYTVLAFAGHYDAANELLNPFEEERDD